MEPNSVSVQKAAQWLALQKEAPHPVVPVLREKFSLSAIDAVAAIREAQLMRGRAN